MIEYDSILSRKEQCVVKCCLLNLCKSLITDLYLKLDLTLQPSDYKANSVPAEPQLNCIRVVVTLYITHQWDNICWENF